MAAGYHDWTAGEVVTAQNVEDYLQLQNVMRFADASARNTALASVLTEGLLAYLLDTNTLTVYSGSAWSTIGPVHGAFTAYTPAVVQGVSVTSTNGGSGYVRLGRLIIGWFSVEATSAGTAANAITVTVPVAGTSGLAVGTGHVVDASPSTTYTRFLRMASTTTVNFTTDAVELGASTLTLASGDTIRGHFMYEAAADA